MKNKQTEKIELIWMEWNEKESVGINLKNVGKIENLTQKQKAKLKRINTLLIKAKTKISEIIDELRLKV